MRVAEPIEKSTRPQDSRWLDGALFPRPGPLNVRVQAHRRSRPRRTYRMSAGRRGSNGGCRSVLVDSYSDSRPIALFRERTGALTVRPNSDWRGIKAPTLVRMTMFPATANLGSSKLGRRGAGCSKLNLHTSCSSPRARRPGSEWPFRSPPHGPRLCPSHVFPAV